MTDPHRIVIVGGGAGGLELATRLGNRLGRRGLAQITLVDHERTHVWKPLLHEVAAGTLDTCDESLDHLAHAHWHYFHFCLGHMDGLDRAQRRLHLAPLYSPNNREIAPERTIDYDTLVIAVGSVSNDFGTPGVKEHAHSLDTTEEAEAFQQDLIDAMVDANAREGELAPGQLDTVIIGGGATGTELAAQLHRICHLLPAFGLATVNPDLQIRVHIVESHERILSALPERLSKAVTTRPHELGVQIHTGQHVIKVDAEGVLTDTGDTIPASFKVWAAGIKAPDFLNRLDGLETNKRNQLMVKRTLQTTRDSHIFAFGDCAACPSSDNRTQVPPLAQAARQQAQLLAENLEQHIQGGTLKPFTYRDWGTLVALGRYTTVGNLMSNILGDHFISGTFARMMYLLLHRRHQAAIIGRWRTGLWILDDLLRRRFRPRVKLH